MKNKFIGMPSEFKYIHSAAGKALFVKEGHVFTMGCGAGEDEEVEFREESLMAADLFVKERVNPEDEAEDVEVTEALMSFIKDSEDMQCSMEQKLAAKDKDIEDKDEKIRMAIEDSEKLKAELDGAKAELAAAKLAVEMASKEVMVERVKEMASKEELLTDKDRSEIVEMAQKGNFADLESCQKEVAMRVYATIKSAPMSFKLPKDNVNVNLNESALQRADKLINKKK